MADRRATERLDTRRADRPGRPYRSPIREQRAAETRRAIVDAAHRLFVTKGWLATGMREVAAEAGVAIETLYGYFSSKRVLLQQVVGSSRGDDDATPVPVAQRPEFDAIGRGSHANRTAAAARLLTGSHRRGAALAKVVREAAPTDEHTAEMLRHAREHERDDVAVVVELIVGRAPTVAERDGIWAMTSPDVYLLLVETSGWRDDQYEAWIAETLEHVLPRARTRRKAADKATRSTRKSAG